MRHQETAIGKATERTPKNVIGLTEVAAVDNHEINYQQDDSGSFSSAEHLQT